MTRASALKTVIRTRIAKTGERYTTARRHVLAARAPSTLRAVPPPAPAPPPPIAVPGASKGSVSDATSRAKTGHGLDHWFAVLDAFGAVQQGHTAAARHLYEVHHVPGWYAQGITVAYERVRGVRAVGQRYDGAYEVSVTKVVAAGSREVVAAFSDARQRARWTKGVDAALAKALSGALKVSTSKGFVVRADGQGRYRYTWGDTVVQFHLYPKPGGKAQVVVTHAKLPDAAALETRRTQWRAALAALAAHLAARD
jgi:hypothetical protein